VEPVLESNANDLLQAVFGFCLRLALVAVAIVLLWLDLAVYHTDLLEVSFTEIGQELMLFACALSFWCAPAAEGQRGFNALAGGFFACLLMRELDGLFDPISHSAWCWPLLLIAAGSVRVASNARNRAGTVRGIAAFVRSREFSAFSTGFAVLVFSRVFGMGALWHLILQGGYARLAKTAVEEGIELLTYTLWLAASIEYLWRARRAAKVTAFQSDRTGWAH
jgi:hypothetical protein